MRNFELVQLLINKNYKISCAESCTGGGISARITSVPGASEIFSLGVCTYALQKTGRWVGRDRYIDRDEIETELELPPKTFCLQHPFWSFI